MEFCFYILSATSEQRNPHTEIPGPVGPFLPGIPPQNHGQILENIHISHIFHHPERIPVNQHSWLNSTPERGSSILNICSSIKPK